MFNFFIKPVNSIYNIIKLIFEGKIAHAFYNLSLNLPDWLFRFNKATMLKKDDFTVPELTCPNIKVKIVDISYIDDIIRISGINKQHIIQMLTSGAECFIASIKDKPPSSIIWSTNGKIFIRGLSFEYDFGPNGYYGYGAFTLLEERNKGLYQTLKIEKMKHQIEMGANSFYSIIEFMNKQSYSLQIKLGFYPLLKIIYLKFIFFKVCVIKYISNKKVSIKIYVKKPPKKMTFI